MADSLDRVGELSRHLERLDTALDAAEPKEMAALLRERRITLSELASLGGVEEGSQIDELAKARKKRRAAAAVDAESGSGR